MCRWFLTIFYIWWKNLTQRFSLLLWNYLHILKILLVTHLTYFRKPKVAILTLKMLTGSHLAGKLILAQFFCNHWMVRTREHQQITEKRILRRISVSIFKVSKYKVNWCIVKWKAFERPWKPSANTQQVLIKMLRPSKKIYPSCYCPFKKDLPGLIPSEARGEKGEQAGHQSFLLQLTV